MRNFRLRSRYSVVMMDTRDHGPSEGAMAAYRWLELSLRVLAFYDALR